MTELETHLFRPIAAAVEALPRATAREIYAFYIVCSLDEGGAYRPQIATLAYLEESKRAAVKRDYGNEFSGWGMSGEVLLRLCDDERDKAGFELQSEFFWSKLQNDFDRERFELYEKLWPVRWAEEEVLPSDWDTAQKMLARAGVREDDRKYLFSVMLRLVQFEMSEAFFEPLGIVLHELQRSGLIERKCGRPVPIGVMATNDVGYEWGLAPTQLANPNGLAREMLEWMRDERFAVTEARARLHAEIAVWLPADQARFWVDCERDVFWFFATDARTPLTDKLESLGVLEKSQDIHRNSSQSQAQISSLLALAAPLLMNLIEINTSNALEKMGQAPKTNVDFAVSLLRLFQSVAGDGRGAQVDDATVTRLEKLMHKLWPEAREKFKRGERFGFCLDYCARVLHQLRPEKYPHHRINSRRAAAFNFEDFGLLE